jgi:hypothetical protein
MKTLDAKLERMAGGRDTRADFVIADAKDADMGFGVAAPGPAPGGGFRPLAAYRAQIGAIVAGGLVDVMLLSASTLEHFVAAGAFRDSPVTPAVRGNDTTDIWALRHSGYRAHPSRPFRTASLARARALGCDLCLYSLTFCDEIDRDLAALDAFAAFREEAARLGMRYFLEVFNPNAGPAAALGPAERGAFVNDAIVRTLAGLMRAERPAFLKIAFNGAPAMRELCAFDPGLVVGVMGGSAGTTRDAFELLAQAAAAGARVSLFGRKVNLAESPLAMLRAMRRVADGALAPAEATRRYHEDLRREGLTPLRPLEDDLRVTEDALRAGA